MPKIFLANLIFIVAIIFPVKTFASQSVLINEILADPADGQKEFVELYFPDGYFDISAYTLKDEVGSTKTMSSVQTCSNFVVYELTTTSGEGWLNNSGQESVFLYDASSNEVDSYKDWQNPGEGKSFGRYPDGQTWGETESPTKCSANNEKVETAEPQPTPSSSTSSKSPSPTPTSSSSKSTATPKSSPKTSPQPKTVLGEKVTNKPPLSISTDEVFPSPSPSPTNPPQTDELEKSASKTKIAAILTGSGAILIGASLAFYLWYRRALENGQDQNKED